MPTTNIIDGETTEAKLEAERRDGLLDSELDTVNGGLNNFQFGVGRAIGTAARGAATVEK